MKKPPMVMVCAPGREFSKTFLENWTLFVLEMQKHYRMRLYFGYDPDIYTSRNQLLGIPKDYDNPKPFNGDEYDYILFIDSDMVFNFYHFQRLIKHDKDIMSGLFMLTGGLYYSCAVDYNPETGDSRRLSAYEGQMKKDIFKVDWNGLAFTLIKKGVFEKIGYPWFKQIIYKTKDGSIRMMSEDVGFCMRAKQAGFDIWVDPMVKVGHEKHWIFV